MAVARVEIKASTATVARVPVCQADIEFALLMGVPFVSRKKLMSVARVQPTHPTINAISH
jgi:hypothetical protein